MLRLRMPISNNVETMFVQQDVEISKTKTHALDLANFQRILKLTLDDLWLDSEWTAFFSKKLCGPCDKDGRIIQMPKHLHLPYFYLLPKVHQTPWKTCPIVSGVSSVNEPLSKWIIPMSGTAGNFSASFVTHDLFRLMLPAILQMAAVSMYINIDDSHSIACY
jgi:hypothetical protein